MAKYLDPKADLTFKKIFGEHPDLVMSLLNALLPLDEGKEITHIEYLPTEMMPDQPWRKNSIVDVRCKDTDGRQFIVEMQMEWSKAFQKRILFNASKAYVRQLGMSIDYHLLQPVYSLSLVNDVFEPDMEEFYHYYRLVHEEHTNKVIEGLNLIFVELPKFKPQSIREKKMAVLWLRFLTEINDGTRRVSEDLLQNAEVKRAIDIVEESAYSDAELYAYDKFWDIIRVERTLEYDKEQKYKQMYVDDIEKATEKGRTEGMEKGMEKGMEEANRDNARKMKALGLNADLISQVTGLSTEEVDSL
ncbi:MAG: Rpn family recombination-promoting nuclease/putative transposase [Prevotella sp.]|nr:Rpn family recombination-promoting nuclease/putative transposase [Prevotella sp.]